MLYTKPKTFVKEYTNKKSYNEARTRMQEANTDPSVYPEVQLQRTFSINSEV